MMIDPSVECALRMPWLTELIVLVELLVVAALFVFTIVKNSRKCDEIPSADNLNDTLHLTKAKKVSFEKSFSKPGLANTSELLHLMDKLHTTNHRAERKKIVEFL